jgi:rubredoxin
VNRDERLREEQTDQYKLFVCVQCGFEYDEEKGWPEDGIAPGTRWDAIPEDWSCPDCGAAKSDFEMIEVALGERSDGKLPAWGERRHGQ